uniref:Short-chain collagen C4 n=1 Tax=Magallana gigas TaxID=29159 RepID=K1QWC4_MAGGI
MYGSEYDTSDFGHENGDDLPCSVCRSTVHSSVLMIPGKSSCYDGWTMQYHGDLVAGEYQNRAATQYICLDEHPEALTAGQRNDNGKLFVPVKAVCGALACPPYHNDRYLTKNNDMLAKYNTLLTKSNGFAGGSYYSHTGATAEFVCLPRDPDLTTKFSSGYAYMYGSEYDTTEFGHADGDDLPCSVCRSTMESSVLMIPGKSSCYDGWSMQYHGDLVAGKYSHSAATQFICLDEHPEALTAGQDNHEGKLFYPVQASCGSLAWFAGGYWPGHKGAAAEFVCLPRDPDLTTKFTSSFAFMYGSEYDVPTTDFGHDNGDDLPCSVCRSTVQSSVLMIPVKSSCYDGWTMQYHGDLVAGHHASSTATQYICLDEHPETLTAGHRNDNGKWFYPMKAVCGALACPPYHNGRYLTCVVCTK